LTAMGAFEPVDRATPWLLGVLGLAGRLGGLAVVSGIVNPYSYSASVTSCWCGFGFHGLTIFPNGADMALHPACTFVFRPCTPTRLGTVRSPE
jgi:hypothetical protein